MCVHIVPVHVPKPYPVQVIKNVPVHVPVKGNYNLPFITLFSDKFV